MTHRYQTLTLAEYTENCFFNTTVDYFPISSPLQSRLRNDYQLAVQRIIVPWSHPVSTHLFQILLRSFPFPRCPLGTPHPHDDCPFDKLQLDEYVITTDVNVLWRCVCCRPSFSTRFKWVVSFSAGFSFFLFLLLLANLHLPYLYTTRTTSRTSSLLSHHLF